MKKITKSILALLLIVSLVFTGCSKPNTDDNNGTSDSGSGTPKDTINLRLDAAVTTLDPAKTNIGTNLGIITQIYEKLYFVKADHTLEPRLAESYEIADDNVTYTIKLKEGVKFHNGEELKASDVVFTVNRAIESPYLMSEVVDVESTKVIDDYTLEIKLKNVSATFFESLCSLYIVNEKAVTESGEDYGLKPVGTGPYKFVSYENASIVKLTSFEDYHRGAARIKNVKYSVIPDPNTATIALETGEIDFGSFAASSYENIKNNSNLIVEEIPSTFVSYLVMNVEAEPFNNKLVRQAVNYALDREFISEAATEGMATPTSTFLCDLVLGYSDDVKKYDYNPEKAKELLKEANIETPLNVGKLKTIDGVLKKAAEVIQSNLEDIGIIIELEIIEQGKFVQDTVDGNFSLAMFAWTEGYDADNYSLFYTPENIGSANLARYNNKEVNDLFMKGKTTLDNEERLKIYEDCFNIIQDDAPYALLYNQSSSFAYNKNLKLDHNDILSTSYIYDMSWE